MQRNILGPTVPFAVPGSLEAFPGHRIERGIVGGVRIGWVGDRLRELCMQFGPHMATVPHRSQPMIGCLKEALSPEDILDAVVRAGWPHVWYSLQEQGEGQKGRLLVNGAPSAAKVEDWTGDVAGLLLMAWKPKEAVGLESFGWSLEVMSRQYPSLLPAGTPVLFSS